MALPDSGALALAELLSQHVLPVALALTLIDGTAAADAACGSKSEAVQEAALMTAAELYGQCTGELQSSDGRLSAWSVAVAAGDAGNDHHLGLLLHR